MSTHSQSATSANPTPSSRSWRLARRALLALAITTTLVTGFYLVEKIRGQRAWQAAKHLAAERGMPLISRPAELAPPPVPAELNAAELPVFCDMFSDDPALAQAAKDRWTVPKDQEITHELLVRHEDSLAALAEAVRRPRARFPLAYEKLWEMRLPHITACRDAGRLFEKRARLRLADHDVAGAAADAASLIHLGAILNQDGTFISQLTGQAVANLGIQIVAEGLSSKAWSPAHRAAFENALARLDFVAGFARSLRAELNATAATDFDTTPLDVFFDEPSGKLLSPLLPVGWLDQGRALVARVYLDEVFPAIDPTGRHIDIDRLEKAGAASRDAALHQGGFYARLVIPTFAVVAKNLAHTQILADFARIALALEDWRDTHGAYPPTLPPAALSLHNILTGEPFVYSVNPDGTYKLWTVTADTNKETVWPPRKL